MLGKKISYKIHFLIYTRTHLLIHLFTHAQKPQSLPIVRVVRLSVFQLKLPNSQFEDVDFFFFFNKTCAREITEGNRTIGRF